MHDPALAAARVARLATTDPDGRPHLVPIVFALDGDTLYSAVDRKPKRSSKLRRIENARVRPDVTILVDHYEEDWGGLWWIRLRGRARVLDDGDEREWEVESCVNSTTSQVFKAVMGVRDQVSAQLWRHPKNGHLGSSR